MGVLWYGGKIYTMQSNGNHVESVYTKNGYIIDIGALTDLNQKYNDEIEQKIRSTGSNKNGLRLS